MSNELLNKTSKLIEDVENIDLHKYGSYGRDRTHSILRGIENFIELYKTDEEFTVEEFLDRLIEERVL